MNVKIPVVTLAASILAVAAYKITAREKPPGGAARAKAAANRVRPSLERDLTAKGLRFGDPVFLRIFKEERELELWVQEPDKPSFKHFRTYPVVAMSGKLGPKLKEWRR